MRFSKLFMLVACLCCSLGTAQIKSERSYDAFEPIVLEAQHEVEDGQKINAMWRIDAPAQARKVSPTTVHVWAPPQARSYQVMAIVWITRTVNVDGIEGDLMIGPPKEFQTSFKVGDVPAPDPDSPDVPDNPEPSVPDDQFDNLGQRVANWSRGIPGTAEAAAIYGTAATLLREDPSQTVNSASAYLVSELARLPHYDKLTEVRKQINADLNQRWVSSPFSQGLLADYFEAIANGLEAE